MRDGLERADRLAELLARPGVVGGDIACGLGHADQLRGDQQVRA
jgi:hypothetical protein